MALRFRPLPGLTFAVLICLPILIGLGVWQYQRWQWKLDVLAEVEAAVSAPPMQGLGALAAASAAEEPLDFRRIDVSGSAIGETWHLYRPAGNIQWQPFRRVEAASDAVLIGFPSFDDRLKETATPPDLVGTRAGYVRRIRPRTGFAKWLGSHNNRVANRWFEINPDEVWAKGAVYYIDLHPTETEARALPVRRPEIANNHVSYMLTWWSFAIILLIIYGMMHYRAGRLSWR